MLAYWIDPSSLHRGVHVHEIAKRRSYLSTGLGGKAFSFAIVEDLYVPTTEGNRAVALEMWFAKLEGRLSEFLTPFQSKNAGEPIVLKRIDYTGLLMAVIGMEHRSRYDLAMIRSAVEADHSLSDLFSKSEDPSIHKRNLENIIHLVSARVSDYQPVRLCIFESPPGTSWITSDRPFVRDPRHTWRCLVLSNKHLLMYDRNEGDNVLEYVVADEKFNDMINREVALQARDWIVASSAESLDKYVAVTLSDAWKDRCLADHLEFRILDQGMKGWLISR